MPKVIELCIYGVFLRAWSLKTDMKPLYCLKVAVPERSAPQSTVKEEGSSVPAPAAPAEKPAEEEAEVTSMDWGNMFEEESGTSRTLFSP